MSSSAFIIGKFARCCGLNPKTIRYYEEIGLLPQPRRNEAGYRLYWPEDLTRVRFVRRAKLLGLSLAEVKRLADYADNRRCHALQEHLLALVQEKLAEVDRRLIELAALRDDLQRFRDELAAWTQVAADEQVATSDRDSCRCLGQDQEGPHVN